PGAAQQPSGHKRLGVDGFFRVQTPGFHRSLDPAKVHPGEAFRLVGREAALGQAHVDRHLAAFEAIDGDAAARLLALDAPAARLALAGADALAQTDAHLAGAGPVSDLIEFHG